MARRTIQLLSAFLISLEQPAAAFEKYICHLNKSMDVTNSFEIEFLTPQ
jgi:hypothetical protein